MLTLILSLLLYIILRCPKILGTRPFMHWTVFFFFCTLVVKDDFELSPDEAAHVCSSSGHKWMTCEEGGCQETETL